MKDKRIEIRLTLEQYEKIQSESKQAGLTMTDWILVRLGIGHTQRTPIEKTPYHLLRFEILKRDKFTCQYCGRSVKKDKITLQVDHKIPKSKGGNNAEDNLVTSCFECNIGKSDVLLDEIKNKKSERVPINVITKPSQVAGKVAEVKAKLPADYVMAKNVRIKQAPAIDAMVSNSAKTLGKIVNSPHTVKKDASVKTKELNKQLKSTSPTTTISTCTVCKAPIKKGFLCDDCLN